MEKFLLFTFVSLAFPFCFIFSTFVGTHMRSVHTSSDAPASICMFVSINFAVCHLTLPCIIIESKPY